MPGDLSDYRSLFLNNTPMLDVRAPVEFNKGAFPCAKNLPLMNDAEREKVGTCYKQQGSAAAQALGHQLVRGANKEQRVAAWAEYARAHPEGAMYCFRGGLRSQIAQAWLADATGIHYPRVAGGYKAMRSFLLETLEQAIAENDFVILGGLTGTGKTDVLEQLCNGVDLEAHAHHRGSSFGRRVDEQPAQIDFENRLAIDLLKKRYRGMQRLVIEDEGQFIGRCSLPFSLIRRMRAAPVVWLEDTQEARILRILRDYVVDLCDAFVAQYGPEVGFDLFAERLRGSLNNIRKRLGHERHGQVMRIMDAALAQQMRNSDVAGHREWIAALLSQYYDPMYAHQRQDKAARIVFSGDGPAVLQYLRERVPATA